MSHALNLTCSFVVVVVVVVVVFFCVCVCVSCQRGYRILGTRLLRSRVITSNISILIPVIAVISCFDT